MHGCSHDVLRLISRYLESGDLVRLSRASRRLHHLCRDKLIRLKIARRVEDRPLKEISRRRVLASTVLHGLVFRTTGRSLQQDFQERQVNKLFKVVVRVESPSAAYLMARKPGEDSRNYLLQFGMLFKLHMDFFCTPHGDSGEYVWWLRAHITDQFPGYVDGA